MSDQSQLLRMLEPSVRPMGSPAPNVQPRKPVDGSTFEDLLSQVQRGGAAAEAARPLKLSAHATQRLEERGVTLSEPQLAALAQAADRAEAKGAKDALMMMDKLGMVVNLPNRTVLTVLDEGRMQDGVVTNIDSAVIVNSDASSTGQSGETHRLQL